MVLSGYTIRGSIVGTRIDLEEALAFAAEGKVKATIEMQPLSAINDVFERMKKGKVNGRVVLDLQKDGHREEEHEMAGASRGRRH
jgi:propanol-preferring alcohol dehydrogenase